MKQRTLGAHLSSAWQLVKHGAIGGLMGAALGFLGAVREGPRDPAVPLDPANPMPPVVLGGSIGCIAGLLFWSLRGLRNRGGPYYFLSWGISVGIGTALVLLPTIIKTKEWLAYAVAVAVFACAGCGLGAYIVVRFKGGQYGGDQE